MDNGKRGFLNFLGDLILVVAPVAMLGYFLNTYVDVLNGPKDAVSGKSAESLRKAYEHWTRTHPDKPFPTFDEYEKYILSEIVFPEDVSTSLEDIGGLDDTVNNLMESVVFPLRSPELYSKLGGYTTNDKSTQLYSNHKGRGHNLLRAPLGVLFYGPPGTGKTLTARALARESESIFIATSPSMLQSKWHGESEKLVRALFSVAHKLSPSIIFIDEIDVFLAQRGGGAHEVTNRLTGEFLAQWDGVHSGDNEGNVVVIGATNRTYDLDEAVLRRMPRQILFDLPNFESRMEIAKVILGSIQFDEESEYIDEHGISHTGRDAGILFLAQHTEGYSGADMKEACRFAAQIPVSEFIRENRLQRRRVPASSDFGDDDANLSVPTEPRLMNIRDLEAGLQEVKQTGAKAREYLEATHGGPTSPSQVEELQRSLQLLGAYRNTRNSSGANKNTGKNANKKNK